VGDAAGARRPDDDAQTPERAPRRAPSIADALIPLMCLATLIGGAILLFGLDALNGPVQVALLLCSLVAALIALKNGYTWEDVQRAAQGSMVSITSAIFILLAVGALIGVWNLSGTIPTLVYYGLQLASPQWYYATTALTCGLLAVSIGSSWTTAGTLGVGLVGIAALQGMSPAVAAGAVISGAYLGDKLSPLSETTVLAAQLVGIEPRQHVRRQAWTSIPAFAIAVVAFAAIGLVRAADVHSPAPVSVELHSLADIYHITPLNLLPVVLLATLSIRKVPATLALTASTLFAGALGAILQPQVYDDFVGGGANGVVTSLKAVWSAMANGFSINSGIAEVDRLLSRGGMDSMLPTVWLIIGAVTFGALLEELGLIARLLDPLIAGARSTGRLFVTVSGCCVALNVVAGDQYIALVLPTRLFRREFAKRHLAASNLSRLTADSGTVTSPLVPWNSCGAFMAAVLGVATLRYLPFAIFCIASPFLSLLYGITGFKIERTSEPHSRATTG
jgi:NhaC family Na+:H+ antiporter